MSEKYWYDDPNPDKVTRSFAWRLVAWFVAFLILGGLISVAIWFFTVVLSGPKGEGDATIQKNSGVNRVQARQEYQNVYNDIKGADQRIDVMAEAYKADPSNVNRINLTGSKTYCISRVNEYNALSKKYLSADWRPEGLPAEIDSLDPAFDCKETTK